MRKNKFDSERRSTNIIAAIASKYPTVPNNRPNMCLMENYRRDFKPVVSANSSYASSVRNDENEISVVGDSHVKRIGKNDFGNELEQGKTFFFRSFNGRLQSDCIIILYQP